MIASLMKALFMILELILGAEAFRANVTNDISHIDFCVPC
jgi:hypothetical protein